MENIYLDNSATTRLDDEVLKEMMPYLTNEYGNASSIYKLGRNNKKAVEIAREKGIDVEFIPADLGSDKHPNTVKIVFIMKDGSQKEVMGSSIGGGNVQML